MEIVIYAHMLQDGPFLACLSTNHEQEFEKFIKETQTKPEDYEMYSSRRSFAISPSFRIRPL